MNEHITTDVASLDASNHPRTRKSLSDNSLHPDTKPPPYDSPVIPQPIRSCIVECIDNSTTQNCNYIYNLLSTQTNLSIIFPTNYKVKYRINDKVTSTNGSIIK